MKFAGNFDLVLITVKNVSFIPLRLRAIGSVSTDIQPETLMSGHPTMLIKAFFLAAFITVSGAPALAQSERAHSGMNQASAMHSTPERSGEARPRPTAKQMNRAYGNHYRMRSNARAQYRRDQRAYMAAVMRSRHNRAINQYDRRYARQQSAYAKAMAAWRVQVKACKRGNHRACKAPSPRTADFY